MFPGNLRVTPWTGDKLKTISSHQQKHLPLLSPLSINVTVDGRIVIPITEAPNPAMALLQPSKCHRDAVPARSGGDCILCLIDKLLSWIFLDVKRREAQG
ncbi:hypothetical protein GWI33_011691 [Rhynchophorus ferrugineus]|uniref:Uncharacterized protein n=1 Tax=Rhynchophorus ferrugineus TaxID=354439 RepID=A0A834I6M5_RHYFE|nr:hypothetical protein GWI33_011691 [Rhynchophorus ferrugineus]